MEIWRKQAPALLPPSARSPEQQEAVERWVDIAKGEPPWLSGKRPRSLNVAASSVRHLARLVLAECSLQVSGDSARGRWLQEQLSGLLPQLGEALQQALISGSVALKPYVEQGRLRLEWLGAQQFYPVKMGPDGQPEALVFLAWAQQQGQQYLRAEYHRWEEGLYRISNSAFVCDQAGRPCRAVPLSTVEDWAQLQEEVKIAHLRGPLYALWALPWQSGLDGSPEGASLFAAGEQTLEDLDRLYNDYCFEFDTARRKLILREDALQLRRDGRPILPQDEHAADVYLPLDLPGEGAPFGDYSPAIREENFRQGINQLLRLYELQCGVSAGTFSAEEKSALTATEVIAKDRKTYYCVSEIQRKGRQALEQLAQVLDALADLYGLCAPGPWKLSISFGDSVFEDTDSELRRRMQLVQLGLKPQAVLAWYFDCGEEEALGLMKAQDERSE